MTFVYNDVNVYVLDVAFYQQHLIYITKDNRETISCSIRNTELAEETRLRLSIIILTVSEVAGYVSDRLQFNYPGFGTEGKKKETLGLGQERQSCRKWMMRFSFCQVSRGVKKKVRYICVCITSLGYY